MPETLSVARYRSSRGGDRGAHVQIIAADIGASKYEGVNLGIEKRYSKGLLFKFNYTFSHMMDNVDSRNELAGFPGVDSFTNYYNQGNDWGNSGNDVRQRVVLSTIYELPFGRGRAFAPGNKILDFVVGGWSLGAVMEARTGTPLSPIMLNNTTNSFSEGERPNMVGFWQLPAGRTTGQEVAEWFNTAAFAAPAAYVFGDAGRTFGTGPGLFTLDSSLLKDFKATERVNIQFRVEALNVTNHPNFANPNTQFGSAAFGQITSEVAGNQSRILQAGLHLQF